MQARAFDSESEHPHQWSPWPTAPLAPDLRRRFSDLIDLMAEATDQHQDDDDMAVTRWAIIRLANGNQQRIEVLADNQINARLMIESQYGQGSIQNGPHRLDLMRAR